MEYRRGRQLLEQRLGDSYRQAVVAASDRVTDPVRLARIDEP